MSGSALTAVIITSAAVVLIALERRFPYRRGQRLLRDGLFMDLVLYGLLQSWLLGLLISAIISLIDRSTGLSRLHLVSGWPVVVQFVFFLVTHDLYIYLFHRLQHRSRLLWRIHEAHHSTTEVDWISGARSHALEILINQTIEFAPIVLLGGAPEVALAKGVADAVWGMYIHSNIDVQSGWLQRIINGPDMHRWHHALEIIDVNFGTKFAFWDFLFGTAHHPNAKPTGYGLQADSGDYPRGFLGQQLAVFRGRAPGPAEPAALVARQS